MKFGKLSILVAGFLLISFTVPTFAADTLTIWFPPGYKAKVETAKSITGALSKESGVPIRPRIAKSYPEILAAFEQPSANLVYVGSFVQAIIRSRGLGTPLVQTVNGKEFYSGIMVYPKGQNPQDILKNSPEDVAFTVGASSGESSAKAATQGKAKIGVANHGAAVGAVLAGRAKAAVVKNWWWDANKGKYQGVAVYEIPNVSIKKNPDNVLTASNGVSAELQKQLVQAAKSSNSAFKGQEMVDFDSNKLDFSIDLMKKGGIDPTSYSW